MRRLFLVWSGLVLLASCSSATISDYDNSQPELNLRTFFDGDLVATGIVLDRSGKATRAFTAKLLAYWEGDKGTIEEWFEFNDGERSTRTWVLTDLGDGRFSGTAGDVIGEASGEVRGFAFHWIYQLEIDVNNDKLVVTLDDWMYLVNQNEIINRSVIKKWGFDVGEVILSIRKVPGAAGLANNI